MRLWIWSDLHCEMQSVQYPLSAPAGADVIVIAGDLTHAERVGAELRFIVDRYGLPVVFVPGNHEYYVHPHHSGYRRGILNDRLTMSRLFHDFREAGQLVYVLDDSEMVLGDVRFLGATLWTDFAHHNKGSGIGNCPRRTIAGNMKDAEEWIPDYGRIPGLDAQAVLTMHRESKAFLRSALSRQHAGKTVVVSHHVPHPAGEPPFYRNSRLSCCFTNSADAFGDILSDGRGPELWVYGHTHRAHSQTVGRTCLVCNPYGYRSRSDEQGNGFSWDITIDL